MLRQATRSDTVPEHRGMWIAEELDEDWISAGLSLSRLAPGGALATFTRSAWADGLHAMSDEALTDLLRAWRRLASWATAGELAAVAELDRRRRAQVAAGADPHLAEHVGDELAASLNLTTRSADALLDFACGLARLPLTRAALAAGRIDRAKALVITEGVSGLDDAHAAVVESAVIDRAPDQTSGQLRAATRRAVLAVEPAAARRRRDEALKDARVEVWDERSGTAALAGRDLPPADVLAADRRIDALARQLKSAGREETLSQLRAQVYAALLLGQPMAELVPGTAGTGDPRDNQTGAEADPGSSGSPPSTGDGPAPADRATTDHDSPGSAPAGPAGFTGATAPGPALTGSVNLTMPLATWLGGSTAPGDVAGFGPIPDDDARALAALLAHQPGSRWCLTLTSKDGHPIGHGCARAGPLPAGRDGPGGKRRAGRGVPPPGGPPDGWALTVTIRPLAVGGCSHDRESTGYPPSPVLRHIVNVRQRTCGFPGCRSPAARCDQDHTIPYDQGGRTCECNLACLCRRHHRAKQAEGWRLEQPEPGVLIWRLPNGRSYRVKPASYPGG